MATFYCYILSDPTRNNEPFYVGKGTGDRAWVHLRRKDRHPVTNRIATLKKLGMKPNVSIYGDLDLDLALLLEIELISKYGRRDKGTGILWNFTDGGEGQLGNKGAKRPEATLLRMSKAKKGQKYSEEARANMKVSALTRIPYTEERNRKISEAHKGHFVSEETRRKISEHHKNDTRPNAMQGKKHSPETIALIKAKAAARWAAVRENN